ncbi:MAG: PAS domain S-box protein [Polyangiaceae bacterium]
MSSDESQPFATLSDEHFRLLVENVKDYAIYLLDPRGIVISWSEGARRINGYSAGEIVGQHFSKFYLPADIAAGKCDAELDQAMREGRVEDIGWRVRKDGAQYWASVVITALFDRSGKHIGFAKVARDLTEDAYRAFVEATNAIVWTADGTGKANADSPTWRAFTGQSEEEWLGLRGWEPVHPEDRAITFEKWTAAKAEQRIFEAEFRMRRHDGEYVWMSARALPMLHADGTTREWFGVTFDISDRKLAENRLSEALEREHASRIDAERAQSLWTTTLSSIGDAVIATDTEGRVTFMNPIAESLTGWSLRDAELHPLTDVFRIFDEETRRPLPNPVDQVLRGGKIVGLANHTVLVRRDGTEIPIDDTASPIRDGGGKLFGVVLVFRDVTEEKRVAIRREYIARAGEMLAATVDYREALGKIVELAVPRLADWCAVDILDIDSPGPVQIAVVHADPNRAALARDLGRRYPADPNAARGVANVIRTGRAEIYPEITPDMVAARAIDDEHLRMLRALKLRSAMIVPLRGRERVFGALTFVYAESGRAYCEADLQFVEELAHRAALVIERRMLEDERVRLLEAERHAREQAEIANRTKDEFLATASHELRNPLQAILGWTRILIQRDVPPEFVKPLQTIERNALAQARLIEDVLDVSRIISGKLRLELGQASVSNAVSDVMDAVRPAAEAKGLAIVSRIDPRSEVFADQVRLQQIISNLVSNAVKFTPKGGEIVITAEPADAFLRISVRDTGEGVEGAMLSAIFEPFRQADASSTRRHGGLGLGLAIVRQLVIAHGGTVRAESDGKGRGATFTVELPARAGVRAPPPSRRDTPPGGVPRLPSTRVLVVDDDPDAVELVHELLTNAGAIVQTAQSAQEALERLTHFHPQVLVSDIGMPDVDGYGLIRNVRSLEPARGGSTPAVALTAYASREDAERCLASGFQGHLSKPVDPEQLVRVVANLAGVAAV